MNGRQQEALAVRVRTATQLAVQAYFEELNSTALLARQAVKKARKKGITTEQDEWTEQYHVNVRHYGGGSGRNADITMEGCKRSFSVLEQYRPTYNVYDKTRQWWVRLDDVGGESVSMEATKDFESAVQNCVVALLGHAYYEGD